MAKHVWSLLCRRAVVDMFTNTVSMFDAIEDVNFTPKTPIQIDKWSAIPLEAVIVSFVVRSDPAVPEQSRLRIDVVGPDGDVYEKSQIAPIDLTEPLRVRHIMRMRALPFRGFGSHKWRISLEEASGEWIEVAEIPIEIKPKAAVPAEPPTERRRVSKARNAKAKTKTKTKTKA